MSKEEALAFPSYMHDLSHTIFEMVDYKINFTPTQEAYIHSRETRAFLDKDLLWDKGGRGGGG